MDTTQLQKEKLSHLKALIALACADSRIDLSEHEMIKIVMEREGLTHEDYNRCLHAPESIDCNLHELILHVPSRLQSLPSRARKHRAHTSHRRLNKAIIPHRHDRTHDGRLRLCR